MSCSDPKYSDIHFQKKPDQKVNLKCFIFSITHARSINEPLHRDYQPLYQILICCEMDNLRKGFVLITVLLYCLSLYYIATHSSGICRRVDIGTQGPCRARALEAMELVPQLSAALISSIICNICRAFSYTGVSTIFPW